MTESQQPRMKVSIGSSDSSEFECIGWSRHVIFENLSDQDQQRSSKNINCSGIYSMGRDSEALADICQLHMKQKGYYCVDWHEPVCYVWVLEDKSHN